MTQLQARQHQDRSGTRTWGAWDGFSLSLRRNQPYLRWDLGCLATDWDRVDFCCQAPSLWCCVGSPRKLITAPPPTKLPAPESLSWALLLKESKCCPAGAPAWSALALPVEAGHPP